MASQLRTAIRTCPLCEATCGLELTLDGDRVVAVRGDADDVFSHGYLCPKGAAYGDAEADPDRLRAPRLRVDGGWREVGWDDAFEAIERRLTPIVERHGRDAVALYVGNPNAHHLSGTFYVRPLAKALGTRNVYTASTVDQMPKHVSSGLLFGGALTIPVPDVDRTDHLVVLGANPWMSNGSLCTAPDLPGRLRALRRRGGKLVVVDPRRSRTARNADEWVGVRPGTDAYLLAGMAATLVEEGRVALRHLDGHVSGVEPVMAALARFAPEVVAPACGVDAATIRRLARELAAARTAAVYGRMGTTTVAFGTLTSWLVDVLNVLTGNLDRPGGAMFPRPAHELPGRGRRAFAVGRWRSRVRGLPEVIGELPVATLADEILTPGEGQVRALITVAGNPARSVPDSGRMEAALDALELLVCVDPYVNATTRFADVILPPEPSLARGHYDAPFYALAVRNVANYSPPVIDLPAWAEPEWRLLLRLAGIAAGQGAHADVDALDRFVAATVAAQVAGAPDSPAGGRDADALLDLVGRSGPERILDLLLRAGPYGDRFGDRPGGLSLAALEDHPHGVDLGPLEPRIPEVLRTLSGTVELAHDVLFAELDRLEAELGAASADGRLLLVGRRHLRTNNSWMHNVPRLAKGDLCTLHVHPDDAARLGLVHGGRARVTSAAGEVVATVEVTEDLRPGVVSLPHGFDHAVEGVELSVARTRGGANANVLAAAEAVDPVSGNAVLNAIAVEVAPVEVPDAGAEEQVLAPA